MYLYTWQVRWPVVKIASCLKCWLQLNSLLFSNREFCCYDINSTLISHYNIFIFWNTEWGFWNILLGFNQYFLSLTNCVCFEDFDTFFLFYKVPSMIPLPNEIPLPSMDFIKQPTGILKKTSVYEWVLSFSLPLLRRICIPLFLYKWCMSTCSLEVIIKIFNRGQKQPPGTYVFVSSQSFYVKLKSCSSVSFPVICIEL